MALDTGGGGERRYPTHLGLPQHKQLPSSEAQHREMPVYRGFVRR